MDLLQIIKLVSIPKWVKFFSLGIIAIFMGLAIYVIFGGTHLAEGTILQAGMGLLGVLLPLSIAILFLSFYEAGVSPLKKATEKVLRQLVPDTLSHLGAVNGMKEPTRVTVMYGPGHTCHYLAVLPDGKSLRLEIQLNVRKVCLVVYFQSDGQRSFSDIENKLKHTLEGARHEGYTSNNIISRKKWGGVSCDCLVLYKALLPDFLWNSAEKLYFAQDLKIMLDSLISEAADLLPAEEKNRDE